MYETFVGKIPEGYHINHINRNRKDNNLTNLEPLSPRDNNLHYKANLTFRGHNVNTSKLTAEQVAEIRKRRANGETKRSLAKEYGVYESSIYRVVSGKTWAHTL